MEEFSEYINIYYIFCFYTIIKKFYKELLL